MTNIVHKSLNYKPITSDGLIQKKLVTEGFGPCPGKGMEVVINYYSETEDDRLLDNTNIIKEPYKFIIGKLSVIPGLEISIKSMKMGERSVFKIAPEYTYFSEEKFKNCDKTLIEHLKNEAFKVDIPDKEKYSKEELLKMELKDAKKYQNIYYEIELVKFDKPRPKKIQLEPKERIEQASQLKLEGNDLFKEKRFQEAIIKYKDAREYLTQMPNQFITDEYNTLQHTLTLNITNCYINLKNYNYGLKNITENFVFEKTPKVFYFKSLCEMHIGEFENSYKHLLELQKVLPDENQLKKYFDDYYKFKEETIANEKNNSKKGIMGMYNDLSKENDFFSLPKFNGEDNTCFYFDYLINGDEANPKKIKFEIFHQTENKIVSLFNELKSIIEGKKIKDKIIKFDYSEKYENIILFEKLENIEIDNFNLLNIFSPNEDVLLLLHKLENGDYNLEISTQKLSDKPIKDLLIIGRSFYNYKPLIKLYENKLSGEIKITDCDLSYNY